MPNTTAALLAECVEVWLRVTDPKPVHFHRKGEECYRECPVHMRNAAEVALERWRRETTK